MFEKHHSLSELCCEIQAALKQEFQRSLWVVAEIAELREHTSGHCYLELIEKPEGDTSIVARIKAQIWSRNYRMIKPYFETTTKQSFTTGMKVLLQVTVEFHEMYGISLTVTDIEPSFTLGENARKRLEILAKLESDGTLNMNKELELPRCIQRIAIISSSNAAGFGDFMDHLTNNSQGYIFYTKLFPAIMQGAGTEESIIHALDKISEHIHFFDLVIIIRGGGAVIDLATFDNYNIATHIAQFPLPVLIGIGHDRDETVLDQVAHTSVKTPTAAADFLITHMNYAYSELEQLTVRIPQLVQNKIAEQKYLLLEYKHTITRGSTIKLEKQKHLLQQKIQAISHQTYITLNTRKQLLEQFETRNERLNPQRIFKLGYSLSYINGKRVRSISELRTGDTLQTAMIDGTAKSKIETLHKKEHL